MLALVTIPPLPTPFDHDDLFFSSSVL